MIRHVEGECKCDACENGGGVVPSRRQPKSAKTERKRSNDKKAAKGKTDSRDPSTSVPSLSDEAFTDAKDAIAAAKREIHALLFRDNFRRYIVTEEGKSKMKEQKLPKTTANPQHMLPFCTAVPKKKGTWGSWDPETHLDDFKGPSKKVGYYHLFFAHCEKEYSTENLLFTTACNQLESLESNRSEYFALLMEIYKTFVAPGSANEVNVSYGTRKEVGRTLQSYEYFAVSVLELVHAAMQEARKLLYNPLFLTFADEDRTYRKKEDKHVDRYDPTPNHPNPNIDYWFHDGKKTGFKTFKKFAKKQKGGDAYVSLLDFYTACREIQANKDEEKFIEVCQTYIDPQSQEHLEMLGRPLLEDIGMYYAFTQGGIMGGLVSGGRRVRTAGL